MKTTIIRHGLLSLVLGTTFASTSVFAEQISGKLNGHDCAHAGKSCPVDRLDPHIALEREFVLQKSDGEYVFLSNVPRSVKVRHALSDVQVTGKMSDRYHSVDVDEFRVKSGDGYRTVWSKAQQRAEFDSLYSEGGLPIFN